MGSALCGQVKSIRRSDNASQRIILDDRQERRQTMQAHESSAPTQQKDKTAATDGNNEHSEIDKNSEI
ncbi:hypothetical protein JCM18900_12238 [Psychrobacter sp. JCM 18900]|nr:hypothetical protein JCM18900_12238 [Psychrobacter sp. JCM 18900]